MYDLNEAISKLVQYYRHDFLNILQMVSGLAQLQKTDRLMAYIRKASDEVQQFGRFIGCGDARFALLLYDGLLRDLDGTYDLRVDGLVPLLETDVLNAFQQTLESVYDNLQSVSDCTLSVHIQGGQAPKISFRLSPEQQADAVWQPVAAAAKENGLFARVQSPNCTFFLVLDKHRITGEK